MSKIVIDARELRTSSGRYIERLLHYLQNIDNKNEYKILLAPKDIDGWEANDNFEKIACPIKEFTFDEQIKLKKQIEGLKPDLVHFAFAQQPIWYKGKTITTVHDLTTLRFINPSKNLIVFKAKQQVYAYVIKKATRKSSFVITPTEYVKDDLINFSSLDSNKVVVTYESADLITEKPQVVKGLDGKDFIMYVGRPTPHKNLERLIDAFVSLKRTSPNLILALAGKKDFNYELIENKVKQNNIEGVVFTDFISEGNLRWMYENCQAYVFPSLSEGFGLPGLEAMVHGAPVISSNATCLPEVYGDAAKYFNPLDIEDMARSIEEVLSSKEIRAELVSKGSQRVKDYSWLRMSEETLKLYNEALK